jgi:hypothetical protein
MIDEPLVNGANGATPKGRDNRGRFAKGNRGGPGNPQAKRTAVLRAALADAVTAEDVRAIAKRLVIEAKSGDISAVRELLDRVIGRPVPADVLERVEALEQAILERSHVNGP